MFRNFKIPKKDFASNLQAHSGTDGHSDDIIKYLIFSPIMWGFISGFLDEVKGARDIRYAVLRPLSINCNKYWNNSPHNFFFCEHSVHV